MAECVHLRKPGKHYAKIDPAWHLGLWLGKDTLSGETFVSNSGGSVIRVRAVKRLRPSEQFQLPLLQTLKGTPERMRAPHARRR